MSPSTLEKGPVPPQAGEVLQLLPPFPVVLVTVQTNVLTINQLHYFTFSPLRIGIAVARGRHSFGLLQERREFVINVPGIDQVEPLRICGSLSGRSADKFAAASLEYEASLAVAAPSLRQCPVNVECRVEREVEFEDRVWFIGSVVACRCRSAFDGTQALLCGRRDYRQVGPPLAAR